MKWLKGLSIVLAVLLVIGAALPFFIRLDHYIPRIEKEASARLGEPVSIKSIRFAALPLPHVKIDGITIGTTDDIRLGKVLVTPDLLSLLQSTRAIKSVEIDSLALTQKALDRIPGWARPPGQLPPFRVESVRLSNARIMLGTAGFGPFDAHISLDGNGAPVDASITTGDGKLKAHIKPGPSGYLIDATAKAWTPPVGPALVFDELTVTGVATLNDADLSQVSAKLYGGTASGKATVSWQKGLRLNGSLDVSEVETQKIAAMLSSKTHVSGRLSAKPVFSAAAPSAGHLINALRLEAPFDVQNGVLHGIDIQKAAAGLMGMGATGGETRFEHLSGHLVMERGSYRFTQLRITSGALAADGQVTVSPKKALSGRVNARLTATGSSAHVPLNVAGTVDAPLLYPTGGTVAGAAVGTVIMGPGFGTSVGATVGGWAESLFGGTDEKAPKK